MFAANWTRANIAAYLHRAAQGGVLTGTTSERDRRYTKGCTAAYRPDGSILILTRESGYHTSGWWKNPDYERCLHLSLSFRDPDTGLKRGRDKKLTKGL
jgi:hypothetical protein